MRMCARLLTVQDAEVMSEKLDLEKEKLQQVTEEINRHKVTW